METENPIENFFEAKKSVLQYFGCEDDFFVKSFENERWVVKGDDGFYILSRWNDENKKIDAVVVKKDGKPMVYKTDDYTMVVAIDCVKIGFIFKNKFEL